MLKQFIKTSVITVGLLFIFACFAEEEYEYHIRIGKNKVYTNATETTFKIVNEKKNVIYNDLKFVGYAGDGLQILDKDNTLIYLNKNLKIIKRPQPQSQNREVCGTVNSYSYVISDSLLNPLSYKIKLKEEWTNETKVVDTIPKANIKNITFLNGKKTLWFNDNSPEPTTLLIESKNNKIGLKELQNKRVDYFDTVDSSDPFYIKVSNNNLWGYYKLTKIKYKKLGAFEHNLVRFELPDGTTGYLDWQGKEYLNPIDKKDD